MAGPRVRAAFVFASSLALALCLSACDCGSTSRMCSPSNCTGCCSFGPLTPANGTCVGTDFQANAACGVGGQTCAACAQGALCVAGACVRDAGPDCVLEPDGAVDCIEEMDAGPNCVQLPDGGLLCFGNPDVGTTDGGPSCALDGGELGQPCATTADCACGLFCNFIQGLCSNGFPFDAGVDAGSDCLVDGGALDAGCSTTSDCACGLACDGSLHVCTTTCFAAQPCSGGCCSLTGQCVAGTAVSACGYSGGACADCSMAQPHGCAPVRGGGQCGCTSNADCPNGTACDVSSETCSAPCGALNQACCEPQDCYAREMCVGQTCEACGELGQPCCPNQSCDPTASSAMVCSQGTCVACGGLQQPCCSGGLCAQPVCCIAETCVPVGSTCPGEPGQTCAQGGSCGSCGGAGQACCGMDAGSPYCSEPGTACDAGTCQGCGNSGQACCPASARGSQCNTADNQMCAVCDGGSCCALCGLIGLPCCPGAICFSDYCSDADPDAGVCR